ncbi:MAG: ABC transporter ATP-binding protein [Planctomycetes bacterium]|nr:ABC transporter ATP-binding protein [Planctomycetota bacterium]
MPDADRPLLATRDVSFGFPERPEFLKPVTLELRAGQCWGLIGPNGAGKSTLLRLLAGLASPSGGTMQLNGIDLATVPMRERARRIAFLPQHMPRDLANSALDVVLMGRYPHRTLGLFESAEDITIARRCLTLTDAEPFAERPLATLSGGEAQRVHLAAALAQSPSILLLDEPTAALDLRHQLTIFTLLRQLAQRDGLAVVVVTHDLNLAARFCTHVLLLNDGRTIATGIPSAVLTPAVLEQVYAVRIAQVSTPGDDHCWLLPLAPTEDVR